VQLFSVGAVKRRGKIRRRRIQRKIMTKRATLKIEGHENTKKVPVTRIFDCVKCDVV